MTNKESVEKARQEYKVVLSEIKELHKEKPYPKEGIDNKIKERDNLAKKLDDLKAETKARPKTGTSWAKKTRIMSGPGIDRSGIFDIENKTSKKSISATTCKRCGNPNATIGFDHCELCETGAEKKQREKKQREQFAKIIPGVQGGKRMPCSNIINNNNYNIILYKLSN